ncbi:MAG TPA: glutamate synthase subunit alpha, partial [Acidimicrobiia bacterium]|nr:glutamate synthase subunit alpha [Acidimicrobiia bacterium]
MDAHAQRLRQLEFDGCGIGFVADAAGTSRAVVEHALQGLGCVRHRAALAADGLSGDGAGILAPIPHAFFAEAGAAALGRPLDPARLGLAFAFFDRDDSAAVRQAQDAVDAACRAEGLELAGWRDVPIDEAHLGPHALADLPTLTQGILLRPEGLDTSEAERRAFRARRGAEAACRAAGVRHYFASFSFRTVTYKALVISDRLALFYPDLADTAFVAPHVVFHSRFSTNTTPAWERAQPFRLLCHNGEINTLQGNEHHMLARGVLGSEAAGLGDEDAFRPVLDRHGSDSAKLDETLELLLRGGRDLRHAVSMLVPEAWEVSRELAPDVREYFRYHACLTEPWDGPAGLILSDGHGVGAALDRNGLRPLRWQQADDGLVACCSEAGAVSLAGHGQIRRGRLGPGEMLWFDPDDPTPWQDDATIKRRLAARQPYGEWNRDGLVPASSGTPIQMP